MSAWQNRSKKKKRNTHSITKWLSCWCQLYKTDGIHLCEVNEMANKKRDLSATEARTLDLCVCVDVVATTMMLIVHSEYGTHLTYHNYNNRSIEIPYFLVSLDNKRRTNISCISIISHRAEKNIRVLNLEQQTAMPRYFITWFRNLSLWKYFADVRLLPRFFLLYDSQTQ